MDDIIFCYNNDVICQKNSKIIWKDFEMSMMYELNYFLDIQINQCSNVVYMYKSYYTKEFLKKFEHEECKAMPTHMHHTHNLVKNETSLKVDRNVYICML